MNMETSKERFLRIVENEYPELAKRACKEDDLSAFLFIAYPEAATRKVSEGTLAVAYKRLMKKHGNNVNAAAVEFRARMKQKN